MQQAAVLPLEAITGPATKSRVDQAATAALAGGQPWVNQNSLLRVGGDQIAEGVRAHMAHLLDLERKVKPRRVEGEGDLAVTVLGGERDPAGTQVLGESQSAAGGDGALRTLTDAFEYATNAALVSLVLNGVTSGITTLTTRGG